MKISDKHKSFFNDVYDVVRLIPEGRATSYGAIAKYLGAPRSSRMVGWAMHGASKFPDVPAHRVVNRNGMLTAKGHFSPPEKMEQLLISEGINVKSDKIVDFKKIYWDPNEHLQL